MVGNCWKRHPVINQAICPFYFRRTVCTSFSLAPFKQFQLSDFLIVDFNPIARPFLGLGRHHVQSIPCIFLEQKVFFCSRNIANKHTNDVWQTFRTVQVKRQALVMLMRLQVALIRDFWTEQRWCNNLVASHSAVSGLDFNRRKDSLVYSKLTKQFRKSAEKARNCVARWCESKTEAFSPYHHAWNPSRLERLNTFRAMLSLRKSIEWPLCSWAVAWHILGISAMHLIC